jgi:hypothetical protein
MKPVIFCGPSLNPREAEASGLLDAEFRAPVQLGSVYRAVRAGAHLIGIVDGYFERVPAVWHKEILYALDEGVAVYGAASMGALRAAELEAFGMVGVGEIYAMFASGQLTDDDEVAVMHAPATSGYVPMSEAMVNIRATLQRATDEAALSSDGAATLISLAKSRFYPERHWDDLLSSARSTDLSPEEIDSFAAWLPTGKVNLKRLDAMALLTRIEADIRSSSVPVPSAGPRFAANSAWAAFEASEGDFSESEMRF